MFGTYSQACQGVFVEFKEEHIVAGEVEMATCLVGAVRMNLLRGESGATTVNVTHH
jgi:hypothetical protein